jgi:hypothetical protein
MFKVDLAISKIMRNPDNLVCFIIWQVVVLSLTVVYCYFQTATPHIILSLFHADVISDKIRDFIQGVSGQINWACTISSS